MRWIWILLAAALLGCNSPKNSDVDPAIPGTFTYNYTLSSNAGNLPNARNVIYVSSPTDGFCSNIAGPFNHDFTGTVSGSGQSIQINPAPFVRSTYYWESIYLDVDNTGTLTSGDLVWGPDPDSIFGFCLRPAGNTSVTQSQVWEDLGNVFGGYVTYSGATQTF
jgi:hypothetical protein